MHPELKKITMRNDDSSSSSGPAHGGDDGSSAGSSWGEMGGDSSGDDDDDVDYDYGDSSSDDSSDDDSEKLEHCVLNFCGGEYDGAIRDALDSFSESSAKHGNDNGGSDLKRPPDWDTMEDIARHHLEERFRACIEDIRGSDGSTPFIIDLDPYKTVNTEGGAPIVSHHASLAPCWDDLSSALSKALTGHDKMFISSLRMPKVELTAEALGALSDGLRGRVKAEMVFVENKLCESGIVSMSDLVESNSTLGHFRLVDNPTIVDHERASTRFFETVGRHPSLHQLTVTGCHLGRSVPLLESALTCGVTELVLSGNGIGSLGAVAIARHLESNPPLHCLFLDRNSLNDEDAISLSCALRKNTNLNELWVRGNNFSEAGIKSLFRAVFDTSSMGAIWECNHTCNLWLFSELSAGLQRAVLSLGNSNYERSEIAITRRRKVELTLLSSTESLLRYTSELPPELMPRVLSYVQSSNRAIGAINFVYAIARRWEMPSLYAFLGRGGPASSGVKRKRSS